MIVFPNCKINLGLQVLQKRPDGYHDLQTIFYPVAFHDILEFVPSSAFTFQHSGLDIPGGSDSNLCVRSYRLLKDRFPALPPVTMHLHKVIPMGAGLGGGSSDGSFALKALNEHFRLGLAHDELLKLSLQLGSDCPFFIENQPAVATGRGEQMKPLDLDLAGYTLILVHPGVHVSTADAFAGIIPNNAEYDLARKIREPIDTWQHWLRNDFEGPVFAKYPVIREAKEWLYAQGALYASMTGSGSSVFGIFRSLPDRFPSAPWKYNVVPLN